MTEQQFPDDHEAAEADAAEQSLPVDEEDRPGAEHEDGLEDELDEPELPLEADPADAAEQAVSVPVDEDEYR